jgi:hypothetical protein
MSFAPTRPLLSLLLCSALTALGGCETPHSAGFAKVRAAPDAGVLAAGAAAARPLPEGSAEGVPEHLLHEYAQRETAPESEVTTWDLPAKSKRLVVELLVLAARDEADGLRRVMSRQARWGIPDRREFEARPVFAGDDGRAFLDTLRQVAARLGRKENLNCPPIMPPAAQNYVRNGAEPMWCFYSSNDGLDILAFKLVLEGGHARVDYVGMHPERPAGMIPPRTGAPPPPMTPIVRRPPGMPSRMAPSEGGPVLLPPPGAPDGASPQPGNPAALSPQPGDPTQPVMPARPGTSAEGIGAQPGGTPPLPSGTLGSPGARPAQPGSDSSAVPHP